jgi:hypothetical protein
MSILWEMDRKGTIRKTKGPAKSPAEPEVAARGGADPLEERFERLLLASRAMWELLREKTGLSEEDLLRKVEELDLSDGRLDGRICTLVVCANCGKRISARNARCLYCGAPQARRKAFD